MKLGPLFWLGVFPIIFIPLVIYVIMFTPLLDKFDELSIRNSLPDRVNRIAGIKIPKNVKVLDIVSVSAMNGEGRVSIVLELTDQQKQEVIEQITKNSNWQSNFTTQCLTDGELKNLHSGLNNSLFKQNNSYTYAKKIGPHISRNATFCLAQNVLRFEEFD